MLKTLKLLCVLSALGGWLHAQSSTLDIYWVDVEGGAATLIVTPAGESILVDSGEDLDRDASRIHAVAVKMAGLQQIDHFVATHWHSDHYGGTFKLNQLIPLKSFYHHGIPSSLAEDPDFPKRMALYQKVTQGRSRALRPGDRLQLRQKPDLPRLVIECIASDGKVAAESPPTSSPNEECSKKQQGSPDPTDNAKSVALLFQYGGFTFFDGGDLTWEMEERLVCPVNRVGRIDLFQINHHGLDKSNNPVLIRSMGPRVVVINNRADKGAQPNTMRMLQATRSIETIWQVHRNVSTGPKLNTEPRFIANQEVDCQGEFIWASVQPDGSFSVRIGQTGTEKEYGSGRPSHPSQ